MSNNRQSLPSRRVPLTLALLLTAALAACDTRATAPTELRRAAATPAAIEGDTTQCLRGWVIVHGVYVCNGEG